MEMKTKKAAEEKWESVKLEEICKVLGGTTPSTTKPEFWNGDIIWLSPVDLPEVGSISLVYDSARKITNEAAENTGIEILPINSIVFSTRASIGKIGIVKIPLCTNQGFTNLIPGDKVYYKYLAYALKSNIQSISKLGNSTTFNEVSRTAIKNFRIPLPPLATQQRIAAILDAADALRRKDQELLRKYDELAQAIFIDMFGDPVKNEKGWEVKRLGEVFIVSSGGTPSTKIKGYWQDGIIPWIGSNMCKDEIIEEPDGKFITQLGLENSSAKIFPADTVIVALVGATIGKTGLLKFQSATNQNVAALVARKEIPMNSLYSLYMMKSLYNSFDELGGDKFKMANLSFLRELSFKIPPLELQLKFSSKIKNIEQSKSSLKSQSSYSLFHSLLQQAFSGELV